MHKKGFTLVELLLALTIFTIFLGAAFYVLRFELKTWHNIAQNYKKQQIQSFVLSKLLGDIRLANKVLSGSTPDKLILSVEKDNIEYSLSNYKIKRKKNNYSSYLTTANQINHLSFSYPKSSVVEVELDQIPCKVFLRNRL